MFESYFLELVQGYFLYKYLSMGLLNYMSDDKEEKQAGAEPFLLFFGGGGQSKVGQIIGSCGLYSRWPTNENVTSHPIFDLYKCSLNKNRVEFCQK